MTRKGDKSLLPRALPWVFALYAVPVAAAVTFQGFHPEYELLSLAVGLAAALLFWRIQVRHHVLHLLRTNAPLRTRILGEIGIVGGIFVALYFAAFVLSVLYVLLLRRIQA